MRRIWKGPGSLWGKGKPVLAGQPIPDGHVTEERLKELSDRVGEEKPEPHTPPPDGPREASAPAAPTPPSAPDAAEPAPKDTKEVKRGPGRPPGSKNK